MVNCVLMLTLITQFSFVYESALSFIRSEEDDFRYIVDYFTYDECCFRNYRGSVFFSN